MDKVQIKRAKRNKKKPTLKEKVLAGAGLGATFIGGAAGMSRGLNQQRMVSTISRDQEASSKKSFGERLKSFFSIPKAQAEGETGFVESVTISKPNLNMFAGSSENIITTVHGGLNQNLQFYSSNNNIATVEQGTRPGEVKITATGEGQATIRVYSAQDPTKYAEISVSVSATGGGFWSFMMTGSLAVPKAVGTVFKNFITAPFSWIGSDPRKAEDTAVANEGMSIIRRIVDLYNTTGGQSVEEESANYDLAVKVINSVYDDMVGKFKLGNSATSQRGFIDGFIRAMTSTRDQRLADWRNILNDVRVSEAPDGAKETYVNVFFGHVVVYADGRAISETGRELSQSLIDAIRNSSHVTHIPTLSFNPLNIGVVSPASPSENPRPGETPPGQTVVSQERVLQIINAANTLPYANLTALEHSALNAHLAQNPNALTQKNFATFKRGSVMAWALSMGTGTSLSATAYSLGFTSYDQARDEFNRQLNAPPAGGSSPTDDRFPGGSRSNTASEYAQPVNLEGVTVTLKMKNGIESREGVVPGLGRIATYDNRVYDSAGVDITERLNPADFSKILIWFANNQHLATVPAPGVGTSNLTFRIVGGSTLPNNNAAPHPVAVGQSWEIQITGPVGAQVTGIGGKKTNGVFPTTATPSGTIPQSGVLVINGTFAAEDKGEWRIAWQAGSQPVATIYFNLQDVTVNVTVNTNTLPSASVGQFYNQGLTASGGTGPYIWSLMEGNLPSGLSLSSSGGLVGIPSAVGNASFTVRVRDNNGQTATKQLSLTILSATGGGGGAPPPNTGNPSPTNPIPPPVVVAAPTITQITPSEVSDNSVVSSAGAEITILGSNFNSQSSMNMVFFGNTMTTASQVVPGGIKVKVPTYLKAGKYKIKVANISNIAKVSNELSFEITVTNTPADEPADSGDKTANEQAETEIYGIPKELQDYVFKKLPKSKAWSQFKAWTQGAEGKKNFAIKGINPKTGEAFRLVVSKGQARHIVEKIGRQD